MSVILVLVRWACDHKVTIVGFHTIYLISSTHWIMNTNKFAKQWLLESNILLSSWKKIMLFSGVYDLFVLFSYLYGNIWYSLILSQQEQQRNQRICEMVGAAMHGMSHSYHAISDLMVDLSQARPRHLYVTLAIAHTHTAFIQQSIPVQVSLQLVYLIYKTCYCFTKALTQNWKSRNYFGF